VIGSNSQGLKLAGKSRTDMTFLPAVYIVKLLPPPLRTTKGNLKITEQRITVEFRVILSRHASAHLVN
jgi:hypothetical protein